MSPWAAHFASGNAFFTGTVLLLGAVCTTFCRGHLDSVRLRRWLILIGLILVCLSTTPLPFVFFGLWGVTLIGWWISRLRNTSPAGRARCRMAASAFAIVTVIALIWELSTLRPRTRSPIDGETIYVIGDSVSAGMNEPLDETWPAVMSRRFSADVVNLSQPGATARSALRQAEGIEVESCIVVIEIGGNDLLSGLPASEFRRQLHDLLRDVSRPDRRVLMMELPLPPTFYGYGRAQRELADEYQVGLISKREFVRVLSTGEATVDSVHLAPAGHSLMADQVWRHVRPLLPASARSR